MLIANSESRHAYVTLQIANICVLLSKQDCKLVSQRIVDHHNRIIQSSLLHVHSFFFITSTNGEDCVLSAVTLQRQGKRIDGPGLNFLNKSGVIERRIGKIADVF